MQAKVYNNYKIVRMFCSWGGESPCTPPKKPWLLEETPVPQAVRTKTCPSFHTCSANSSKYLGRLHNTHIQPFQWDTHTHTTVSMRSSSFYMFMEEIHGLIHGDSFKEDASYGRRLMACSHRFMEEGKNPFYQGKLHAHCKNSFVITTKMLGQWIS